jgi:alpha-galactosidase
VSVQRARLTSPTAELIVEVIDGALVFTHWGAPIGAASQDLSRAQIPSVTNSGFDTVQNPGVMREASRGFLGRSALSGHRNGRAWSSHFEVKTFSATDNQVSVSLNDSYAELSLAYTFSMDSFGVLTLQVELINDGDSQYTVNEFIYWLPLPQEAKQSLDFAGRWSNERQPQRRDIATGTWVRDSREGRSGHNFTIAQLAVETSTTFATGSAWALTSAWSGNNQNLIERTPEGFQAIGSGELLLPGEVILEPGESYRAPRVLAVYSADGLDGVSIAFHRHIRARSQHPQRPRPLTLNMWEAIYFEQSFEKIKALVDVAADIGIERVVLDDGWFGSRRDDKSGLGDWVIAPEVWPQGLTSMIDYINSKGIEFGLWFEGEMINPDSDLYRAHPEWVLREADRTPALWRNQLVLDLAHPGAFEHVLEQTSSILSSHAIAYIKWDHNRVLNDGGHLGRGGVRTQTDAIYRLFAELKKRHPQLEIESCASGGARIDLGVLDYVDRFWTSDNNDALERQTIQRWTSLVIPPELLGTHIGPTRGHQTGRTLDLSFRAITALFGHAGVEWDLTQASADEKNVLKEWAIFYKSNRDLLHAGTSVRIDYPDSHAYLYGVVATDQSRALFTYAQLTPTIAVHPSPMKFRGLDPHRHYRVNPLFPGGSPHFMLHQKPEWMSGATLTGRELEVIGLTTPILGPEQAMMIEFRAN